MLAFKNVGGVAILEFEIAKSGNKESEAGRKIVGTNRVLTENHVADVHDLNIGVEIFGSHSKNHFPETRPGGGVQS